ncbi:hypothetical protein D3C76_447620 [compost metagenome]
MRLLLIVLQLLQAVMMSAPDENKEEAPVQKVEAPEKDTVGIKDDLIFLLFLVPVIGVFLPWTRDAIREGLMILNDIPDWFSFIIVLGVVSMFGLRKQLSDILSNFTNFRKK